MTLDEFIEHLFGLATGYLGWTPDIAWATPIPEIVVAAKARAKYMFGVDDEPEEKNQAARVLDTMRSIAQRVNNAE